MKVDQVVITLGAALVGLQCRCINGFTQPALNKASLIETNVRKSPCLRRSSRQLSFDGVYRSCPRTTALFISWPGKDGNKETRLKKGTGSPLNLSGDSSESSLANQLSKVVPTIDELEELATPVTDVLDDLTGGWALSYADLSPADETTPIGISFLLTNLAYGIAGSLLMVQGNGILGFVTELCCIASFIYHYSQLKFGQEGSNIVRLALLVDYIFALSAIVVGSIQLYLGHQVPAEVILSGSLGVASLGACWIWEQGLTYIFFHSLWHLFSGYTGYVIGNMYIQQ